MSKLLLTSDLHLGHKNICKYRTDFNSPEEHDEIVFDNLATTANKRDTVYFLGDIAFNKYWLSKIKELKCKHKHLIMGNHCVNERGITIHDLVDTYDKISSLWSKNNIWFSHCPIHPQEIRSRDKVIHGHLHGNQVVTPGIYTGYHRDLRYINVCLEHTDYKPITMEYALSKEYSRKLSHKVIKETCL